MHSAFGCFSKNTTADHDQRITHCIHMFVYISKPLSLLSCVQFAPQDVPTGAYLIGKCHAGRSRRLPSIIMTLRGKTIKDPLNWSLKTCHVFWILCCNRRAEKRRNFTCIACSECKDESEAIVSRLFECACECMLITMYVICYSWIQTCTAHTHTHYTTKILQRWWDGELTNLFFCVFFHSDRETRNDPC